MSYPQLHLYINGQRLTGDGRDCAQVINPFNEEVIGHLPLASRTDVDHALESAQAAFLDWRKTSTYVRAGILRKAANLIRERADTIAPLITLEQGKPLASSQWEVSATADIFDWTADEGRRAYGYIIPPRDGNVNQHVIREPIGPAAGFSPWNGPALMFGRKVAEALAAGCSCIMKPAEETPATALEITRALEDAGLPPGVLNILFGVPDEISTQLITSPVIRKISFTGSVEVGRKLARLAGEHLKRITLELGGHSPVLIFDDVDIEEVATLTASVKFNNAGQICASPTRFMVQESVYDQFLKTFTEKAANIKLGNGLDPETQMGPLAHMRRLTAMERIVEDARAHGARVETGGKRWGGSGFFFEPTVLSEVPLECEIMNKEPFGPVCTVAPFSNIDAAVAEANRLPYGLVSYAFTHSGKITDTLTSAFESGVVGVNTFAINVPETPFGGVKDSGSGTEGGTDGVSAYLVSKYVARAP